MITDPQLTHLPLVKESSPKMASDFSMDEPSEDVTEEDSDEELLGSSEADTDDDISEEDY